ncbi:MAG: CusA/CzcA family heavy metal efflux RND transporter [Candidatus Wallbacteria bacterium HGW-Wallbacteria-1]|jgi:cobalt-zinc-cadmium resistance protein CzcA|uniref:CusA/CzcA family heavy metal efflux RND transporter n=1 Tax=Candidatus Wallbacteria bacterium HGW-Wallbacteria-1 TaxID=2013854 RepID=A0A2N1PMU4_9BACT|nr:MAG: CusA/CzcA family heavy metal efflux RND transporter [Candidatus Wallbacteria bacterium HGW-Wallbacteria-1]
MFDNFLRFILKDRVLTLFIGAMILVGGFFSWKSLTIDAFPDVTNVQVMLLTELHGLSPAEVERQITYPIETALGGLPGVTLVRSLSQSGLSQVVVVFTDETDIYFAREQVFQRIASVRENLPDGAEPVMGPISTGLGEIMQYSLDSGWHCDNHREAWSQEPGKCRICNEPLRAPSSDLTDLRSLQDWIVSPQLRRLQGVNEVNSFGGRVKVYEINPDPELLKKHDITLDDLVTVLSRNNSNATGGFIVKDWEQVNIVSKGLIRTLDDISGTVVRASEGVPVRISDIAKVNTSYEIRTGAVTRDGKGETVIGMTIMLKGANSKQVVDRIREELPSIQGTLPRDVALRPFYDRTDLIEACVGTVTSALGQGAILIILVLMFFLGDFRTALTVTLTLPLVAAMTFMMMNFFGISANLMTLGGLAIAIGVVVDGSIIVAENMVRHFNMVDGSDDTLHQRAFRGVMEVARPVIFAVIVIIVVFLPLFSLENLEGKMFKPLAVTMIMALGASLLVALTVVPALCSLLSSKGVREGGVSRVLEFIHRIHMPAFHFAMRHRTVTLGAALAVLAATVSLIPRLGTEFLPDLDEGAIAVNIVRLPTASVDGSAAQCVEIEKALLKKFPQIRSVVSKTGRPVIAEDPMGPEQSDLIISLVSRDQWKPFRTRLELVAAIEMELARFPGIKPAFSQPIALRVNELISGIKSDLAVKIFGPDMDVLKSTAESISPIIGSISGARDVKIEQVTGVSQIDLILDREAMAVHMIDVQTVNDLVQTAFRGRTATVIYEGQQRFDARIRLPEEYRRDMTALSSLLIPSPAGYRVPLSQIAVIQKREVAAQISREEFSRRIIVECNVRGRDLGGFVNEAREKLDSIVRNLPEGYRLSFGGQFENQERAMRRLSILVPIALTLIFLMIFTALGDARSTLLILLNLPFGLVGGVLAIYFFGLNLSVAASIGFIALFGVAVEDALVLVSFADQLYREGMDSVTAISEACRLRLRPLLMTTLTTLLGLLPLLYATGSGSEIQRPLVAVVFGGMVSSLLLEFLVLPVAYVFIRGDVSPTESSMDSSSDGAEEGNALMRILQ